MTARLGFLGGTFDPVHAGHLALAEAARKCAALDVVLLAPSARPPHRGAPSAPAADRLEMVRAAIAGRPGLAAWDGEVRRHGASFTVDSLDELRRQDPGAELHLILGWDAARELGSWHQPERVLELARVILVDRPGLPSPSDDAIRAAGLDPARVVRCQASTPHVSATRLRALLAAGGDPGDQVPAPVLDYIRGHHLYAGADPG